MALCNCKVTKVFAVFGRWRSYLQNRFEIQTLGQYLLRRGLITRLQLARALAIQRLSGERLGHVLVRLDYLTEEQLNHHLYRLRLECWLCRLFSSGVKKQA
ncbi:MAG: hypothetical protein WCF85_03150 [Rhodospirillaceae bacterium]